MMSQKIKIKIAWGQSQYEEDIEEYEFDTKEEYFAFMKGVDEANGWMDYSVIGEGEVYETIEDWRKDNGQDWTDQRR